MACFRKLVLLSLLIVLIGAPIIQAQTTEPEKIQPTFTTGTELINLDAGGCFINETPFILKVETFTQIPEEPGRLLVQAVVVEPGKKVPLCLSSKGSTFFSVCVFYGDYSGEMTTLGQKKIAENVSFPVRKTSWLHRWDWTIYFSLDEKEEGKVRISDKKNIPVRKGLFN